MKKILIIITLFITYSSFASNDKVTVKVDGLGCPFCAFGLEKKFKDLKGISDLEIDLEAGIMTFQVLESTIITKQEIINRVDKAGYTPIEITIDRASGEKENFIAEGS